MTGSKNHTKKRKAMQDNITKDKSMSPNTRQ